MPPGWHLMIRGVYPLDFGAALLRTLFFSSMTEQYSSGPASLLRRMYIASGSSASNFLPPADLRKGVADSLKCGDVEL
jgi:hypothetical protein